MDLNWIIKYLYRPNLDLEILAQTDQIDQTVEVEELMRNEAQAWILVVSSIEKKTHTYYKNQLS
jgi:hypothetical protein